MINCIDLFKEQLFFSLLFSLNVNFLRLCWVGAEEGGAEERGGESLGEEGETGSPAGLQV